MRVWAFTLLLAGCAVHSGPRECPAQPVDEQQVLRQVAQLPISTWAYQWAPKRQHLGPMAQDFHAVLGLGDDDKSYDPRDADGVSLAALKALSQLADEQDLRIATLEAEIARDRARLAHAE